MKKLYIQVSTHWDREWYVPFQSFRYGLVKTTDKILEEIESGAHFDTFVFDGQSVVAEDYLEVLPQNEARLKDAVKKEKLRLGPWYVMPDERLVSGESLIRNLMVGAETAAKFGGEAYKHGYVNDIFGHVAQMPQIFRNFGIGMAYMGRGVAPLLNGERHFCWDAPDGSRCYGYYDNYTAIWRGYLTFVEKAERTEEEKDAYIKNYLDAEFLRCGDKPVLLNITDDHGYLTPVMLDMIDRINRLDDVEICYKGFAAAYEEVAAREADMPVLKGELAAISPGGCLRVVTDSLSSYYPLKQANDRCQNLLEGSVSAMAAYSRLYTDWPLRGEFIKTAYRSLLQNQPHDSICGCSADQVHKDMLYRYDQVYEIADALRKDFCTTLHRGDVEESDAYRLTVFNPAPFAREQVVTAKLTFRPGFKRQFAGNAAHQPRNIFHIVDAAGNRVPHQVLKLERAQTIIPGVYSQDTWRGDVYTVAFAARLNAFGTTEFSVVPSVGEYGREKAPMKAGDHWAENDFARLTVNADGTLDLVDKVTGKSYEALHSFLDDADMGNGWFYEEAAGDNRVVTSRFSSCVIERIHHGAVQTTFRITKELPVPAAADYHTFGRCAENVCLKIVSEVTLKADSGRVYIETWIDNRARDHRLRMRIPTGLAGGTYRVAQAFCMEERPVGLDVEKLNHLERESVEKHFSNLLIKRDVHGAGLALCASEGFHAGGVEEDGTMSVVMFRSFGRTNQFNQSERAQLQEPLTFRYTLVPLNDTVTDTALFNQRWYDHYEEIAAFEKAENAIPCTDRLTVSGENVAISTLKPAEYDEKALVLRVFNMGDTATEMTLHTEKPLAHVWSVAADEKADKHTVEPTLTLPPHAIQTLLLEF